MSLRSLRTQLWHLRRGGIDQWRRHRARRHIPAAHRVSVPETRGPDESYQPREWDLPTHRSPRRALRVGLIADEFTELCLRWEWDQTLLTPDRWQQQVEDLELVFVESAWNGNGGAWQYQLTGSKAPSEPLRELVEHCRARGIPTVFWNKEDPVHLEDFLDTARLFDWVLTSDADSVPRYVEELGHDRVAPMAFAAASWIHNPVRPRGRPARDIAFAGMYYRHRFPERRAQMDLLLGAAHRVSPRMAPGLEIFSRFLGGDERYQFPDEVTDRVRGSLTYTQMLSAYRDFKVFLNVSSVPESATMCPRRIFELSACTTPVVSTPTPAIEAYFAPEEMATVRDAREAELVLRGLVGNDEWRDRMGHLAARKVLTEHTYARRVDQVLERVGLQDASPTEPSVSVLCSTNRPHQLDHVLGSVAGQREFTPQLVLVTHGFEAPEDLPARARDLGITDLVRLAADPDLTLGECLNRGVQAADGDLVAKLDDDDLYGPHYLADLRRALDFSGADVVGKRAHHLLLQSTGALMVRFGYYEHRFTDLVMGPTVMTRRELLQAEPFPPRTTGEDTHFLRRVLAGGGTIYAADRYNFIQVRRGHGHTWDAPDAELLANGRVVAYGAGIDHVFT
ncbi:glycosyltransferase [Serinicoccus sp. CNJ-927]|uniref:glycosyltransferase family protein n=1 Tax=Serinicoccus sp. CNJ-927 TaxID=1904970 RepID=UPI0009600A84|nr:glycosyltransferase [Serinicoccus sp. CNJ-927]OLT41902.1 glycosyltransferase [Serinicoccus sp. CNJ-927]